MRNSFGASVLYSLIAVLAAAPCELQNDPNSCRIDAVCYQEIYIENIHGFISKDYDKCQSTSTLPNYYVNNPGELHVVYKNSIAAISIIDRTECIECHFIVELDLSENDWSTTPTITEMPNLKKISLAKNQLTAAKLYNEINLRSLCELDLSHNIINSFDTTNVDEFVYKELVDLKLSHNYLVNLPDAIFDYFSKLERLDVSHNYIDTLGVMTFEGIKHLHYLDLSHNRISELHLSLIRFGELEELYLDHNKIINVNMQDFGRFTNLKILSLKSNFIVSIERNAFKMQSLNRLDLSDNKLDFLNEDIFSHMSNLQTIDISNNKIKLLPKNVFKENDISSIEIKGNTLRGSLVRGTFQGLKSVVMLDLSNQELTSVEDNAFLGMEQLTILLLNNNFLDALSPKAFEALQNLNELDLSNNKLTNLDFEKSHLFRLTSLVLRNNLISVIKPDDFRGLVALTFLDLSNNSISHLETDSFTSLNYLINFEISSNPLAGALEENTFDGLNSLPNLDISQTLFTVIKNSSFCGMSKLKDLNISHSKINELQFNSFIDANSIESIDLSFNIIKDFNVNTSDLIHLQRLYLNNNQLHAVSSNTFKGLQSLVKIHISHNSIKIIDDEAFEDQKDLRYLDLSFNPKLKLNMIIIQNTQSLNNLLLSGIPNEFTFSNITHGKLTHLVISHGIKNNITELGLKNLQQLSGLDLSYNNVTKVEVSAFLGLSQLRDLDLSFNQISFIQPGAFKENSLLYTLNVSHNDLTTVSYGIFRGLIYVNKIDLSFNKITSLKSERFYEVRSLSVLIADHNKIKSVSSEEFSGSSLTELSIGENPIPCEILVNLKKYENSFAITAIRLDNESENVDGVTCNKNAHGTDLQTTEPFVGKGDKFIEEMQIVLLNSSHRFGETSAKAIQDIRDILLNSSRFQSPNIDVFLSNKTTVDILQNLANLTKNIENNQKDTSKLLIEEVNKTNNIFIERTSLLLNKMMSIPPPIAEAPTKQVPKTNVNNTYSGLFSLRLPVSLANLDFSRNQISFIGPSTFRYVSHLDTLQLSHNNLTNLSYGIFHGLKELKNLDLSYNNIRYLDSKVLIDLKQLRVLHLGFNKMNYLDDKGWLGHKFNLKVFVDGNHFTCEWLGTALTNFDNGYTKMRPTVLMESSVENSLEGIPCVPGTEVSQNLRAMNVEGDERLLLTTQKILEAIREQNYFLRKFLWQSMRNNIN